jgi:hypothetical protein
VHEHLLDSHDQHQFWQTTVDGELLSQALITGDLRCSCYAQRFGMAGYDEEKPNILGAGGIGLARKDLAFSTTSLVSRCAADRNTSRQLSG